MSLNAVPNNLLVPEIEEGDVVIQNWVMFFQACAGSSGAKATYTTAPIKTQFEAGVSAGVSTMPSETSVTTVPSGSSFEFNSMLNPLTTSLTTIVVICELDELDDEEDEELELELEEEDDDELDEELELELEEEDEDELDDEEDEEELDEMQGFWNVSICATYS